MASPATQCTETTNTTRRLIYMIRRSFQDLSKSAFVSFYGTPAYSPNLVACINHQERIQISATRLVTGIPHLTYEERLQRMGLHSLQRRRLQTDLITTFKIFTGLFDIDLNLFLLPPARHGLKGHPYKVLQCASHRRRRGSAFSVKVEKYWNKLQDSVNVFK